MRGYFFSAELRMRSEEFLQNFRFGISVFGNEAKYFYFLQNIEAYTSEIQHPISEINSFYLVQPILGKDNSQFTIHHSKLTIHNSSLQMLRYLHNSVKYHVDFSIEGCKITT